MKSFYPSKLAILITILSGLSLSGFAQTTTFNWNGTGIGTGSVQNYSLPRGAGQIAVDAKGAAGGAAYQFYYTESPIPGGRVQCTLNIPAGTSTLYVYVGGLGQNCTNGGTPVGGYNGGQASPSGWGAGSGGESDIRTNTSSVSSSNTLMVAGGAGGGGDYDADGGLGGGTTGGNGALYYYGGCCIGSGGTPSGPGSSGGTLGTQGSGGGANSSCGAGGAGWWGGNAGTGDAAGGGGSSWTNPTYTVGTPVHTQGYSGATGNGQVIITLLCYNAGTITGTTSVCVGSSTTLADTTSQTGGTWTTTSSNITIGATTGVVTGITAGTAVVTYAIPGTLCSGSYATTTVTVNAVPTAITGTTNVCVGSGTTLSSSPPGGAWSSSNTNAGTSGTTGVITGVSGGTATITYTLPGGCATTTPFTVNTAPAAIGGTTSVCPGATTTLTDATSPGTWSISSTSSATIGSTGVVTGITAGSPVVTYTSSTGCIATSVITVNSMNPITGVFGMCSLGTSTTLADATAGGTWSSSNPAIATIGAGTGVVTSIGYGTSNITYTVSSTGCSATAVENISPTAGGIYSITGGGNTYCTGGAGASLGLSGSTSTVSYQLFTAFGPVVGSSVSGAGFAFTFPGLYPAGTYYVVADAGSSCSLGMSGTATITALPLPTPYTVSVSSSSYCAGGSGVHVLLGSSQIGVNYQLYGGGTAIGSPISGTSASLDFGLQTTGGATTMTYSVVGTNTSTGCVGSMSNTVTVTVNPLPFAYTLTGGGPYCSGGTGIASIGLTGSATGTSYQLFYGGSAISTFAGTGSLFNFSGGPFTGSGAYTVLATITATGCTSTMTGTATVTINPLPTVYTVTGGGAYCAGGTGLNIGLNSSATGINYQLYYNNGTTTAALGSAVAGTGSAFNFGLFTGAGSYTVVAINTTTACTSNMFGSAVITINPLPGTFSVTGGGAYCAGGTGLHIGLAGSVTGINYQLFNGGSLASAASGSGSALDFGLQTVAGTYTIVATNTITTCTVNMTGSVIVTINPLPAVFAVTGGGAYCAGGTGAHIGLGGSTSGISYQLYTGGVTSGPAVTATGTPIDFGLRTVTGAYTVIATNTGTSCTNTMTGSVAISTNPLPSLFTMTGNGGYCAGTTGTHIGLSGTDIGVSYQLINGTGIAGAAIAGTAAAIDFGLQTVTGTYKVVASNITTTCSDTMSGSIVVSINALPTPYTVTGSATGYCAGGTGVHVFLSNSAPGTSYQLLNGSIPVGSAVPGNGLPLDFGAQFAAGTYSVVATNTTTLCTNTMSGSAAITVNPLPTPFAVTGGGSYCATGAGVHVGLATTTNGVNYQLYNSGVIVGAPVAGSGSALDFGLQTAGGNYTVIATNTATSCTNSMAGSVTVTVLPLPALHTLTGGGNYCFATPGVHIGLDGSDAGNNYQLMLGGVPAVAPLVGTGSPLDFGVQSATGTYTIVATNTTTGCTNNMIGSSAVNVSPLPTLYTVSGGGNYCPGGSGVHVLLNTSDVGVNYQLLNGTTPVGASMPGTGIVIDFGLQTATGVYTVLATSASTSCTNTMTGSATIGLSPLPTTYNVTGGGNYCPAGTGVHIGLSGSNTGISYQLTKGGLSIGSAISGTGLPLDFGLITPTGTYIIVATNPVTGCANNMNGSAVIGISPLPTAHVITGGGSYCAGGTGVHIGLNGSDIGTTYQLFNGAAGITTIPGTGAALDFGPQTAAGTYTVVAKSTATTCTSNMTGTAAVTISSLPTAYMVTGGGNYCAGGPGVHIQLNGSNTGVNYQLLHGSSPVGSLMAGTGAIIDFGIYTATGTYSVVATNVTGCMNNMSGSVTIGINALPIAYTVTGGGNYCTGGSGLHVMLNGSNTGISYQLLIGGTATGAPITGTGFSLDFGLQAAVGSYTVLATNPVTGCTNIMTGGVSVSTNPLPVVYTVSSTSSNYCVGGAGVDIYLSGSQTGVSYQLFRAGSPVGSALAGTGSVIDFGFNTLTGTYTVVGINGASTCSSNMASSISVVIDPLPVAYTITGGGNYCIGGTGISIGLSGSNTGVVYQLFNGMVPVAGSAIPGTGAALNFGPQTAPGLYTVVATNPATSCTNNMSGTTAIGLNTLPNSYTVTGGGNYCSGGTGVDVGLSVSATGVSYQLYAGSVPVGSPVAGTGAALDFGMQTTAGSYTIAGTGLSTGCANNMTGTANVVVNPLPAVYTVTGGGSYCQGGTGLHVGISSSNFGINYQLYNASGAIGAYTPGFGGAIDFGLQTAAGSYTVVATDATTSCTSNMSGTANVVVNPLPTAFSVTGGGSYCASGSGVAVDLNGSAPGINYQLFNGTSPAGSEVPGNGGILNMGNQTAAGTYTIVAVNDATTCSRNMSGSATVSVIPLVTPIVNLTTTSGDSLCSGNSVTFTAAATNGGASPAYSWTVNGAPITDASNTYSYIPANGDIITVTMTSDAACLAHPSATGSITLNVLESATPSVSAAADPGNVVCQGTSVTFSATPSFGGPAPTYNWFKNASNVWSGSDFTYTPQNGDVIYCLLTSDYRCKLATTATSSHITMEVDVPQPPAVAVTANPSGHIAPGQAVTFTATVSNGGSSPSFQWLINGIPVTGANSATFVYSDFADFDSVTCQVLSSGGCSGEVGSASVTIHIANVGVQTVTASGNDVVVVPNPNKGIFTVKGSFGSMADEEVTLEVTDMIGQVVYTKQVTTHDGTINESMQLGSNVANGMYLLNLRSASGNKVFHLVIEQ